MDNPFVGFDTFAKQHTEPEEHPYGEDSHLDDDSILERHGDVETGDDYYEPDDYDEEDDVDLQWGKVSDAAKGAVGAAKTGVASAAKTAQTAGKAAVGTGMDAAKTAGTAIGAAGQQAARAGMDTAQAAGAKVGEAAQTAGGFAQDAASTGVAAGQKAAKTAGQAATGFGQQAAQTATGLGQKATQTTAAGLTAGKEAAQTAGTAAGAKATDLGTAAVKTAQAAGATAGQTAKTAGQAAGAKVAGAFGKSHDEMMLSLDEAIGFMEKQSYTRAKEMGAIPEGMDEDEYYEWVTYDAPKTPEGRKLLGMKDHEIYGDNCAGEDCVIHGSPESNDWGDERNWDWGDEEAEAQAAEQQAAKNVVFGGEVEHSYVDIPARSNANTSVNKSHDEITSNPFVGFDTVIKQVEVEEEDEITGNSTALRGVSHEGFVGDDDEVDSNTQAYSSLIPDLTDDEDSEVRVVPTNEAQQEVLTGEQQEAEYHKKLDAAQNRIKAQRIRQRVSDKAIRQAQRRDAIDGVDPMRRSQSYDYPSTGRAEEESETVPEVGGRPPVDRTDPSYYAPSAVQNRLEEEARIKRAEQSRRVREEAAAVTETKPQPMKMTEVTEDSDEDYFAQSADNVLAKALGSVIDIMEKQDPRFRCQECGTKVPKGGRKCRKCGSEDIDLG